MSAIHRRVSEALDAAGKDWGAASAEVALREFRSLALRTGLGESYVASWHGRGAFQEKFSVRVDRYRDRCEITAQVFDRDERADWQPAQTLGRLLTASEWEQVSAWAEVAFWNEPSRDTAQAVMDGDCWTIEGYRDDGYHKVYRHTGSLFDGGGKGVFELGTRLARLAGLGHFEKKG